MLYDSPGNPAADPFGLESLSTEATAQVLLNLAVGKTEAIFVILKKQQKGLNFCLSIFVI